LKKRRTNINKKEFVNQFVTYAATRPKKKAHVMLVQWTHELRSAMSAGLLNGRPETKKDG